MKSNLRLIPTSGMSYQEWLRYRQSGIGASEVGVIMGLSPYKCATELFYEKIGQGLAQKTSNLAAFLGKTQEEYISELWEAWDPAIATEEEMMKNYGEGKKVRRCKRVNAYVRNPDFPWLFVSLDFEINKYNDRGNGSLETKTIGGWNADKWEAGFPPYYVTQLCTQMGVCEYGYGESAILQDNRKFYVLPFEFDEQNKSIFGNVISMTHEFWQKVVKAKELLTAQFEAVRTHNYQLTAELEAQIVALEPSPDGSDAYHAFLKERYRIAVPGEMAGSAEDLANARAHLKAKKRMEEAEEAKQLPENKIKAAMGVLGCDRLDFGQDGYISWKVNAKGSRVFLNKCKE